MKVIWKPQPKQTLALIQTADEILFGGARGGGKTDTGQAWLLYDIDHPLYRALVIRRNVDDLRDWIDRARRMYQGTSAAFAGQPTEITFPSGSKIRTGHLKDDSAYTKYQGHEYQKILLEEITHIPRERDYEALLGSCRSTVPELRPQVFSTTNPDGPGYKWVKERWNIPDFPTEPIYTERDGRKLVFIPSRVEDNPALFHKDKGYVKFLDSIQDPTLRRQWREGSWEQPRVEGSYYAALLDQARDEGRIGHFPYDEFAEVDTWWDIGIGDETVVWFSQTIGNEIHVIDHEKANGLSLGDWANIIHDKPYKYRSHNGPHDLKAREFGTGISRQEKALEYGLDFTITPRLSVEDGIDAVRDILPVCYFHEETCQEGIDALRSYRKQYDEKRGMYKKAPEHDAASHDADAFRGLGVGVARQDEFEQMLESQLGQVMENRLKNNRIA